MRRLLASAAVAAAMAPGAGLAQQSFVDKVIRSESSGNFAATNRTSSALGGGQIMFDTARANGFVTGTRASGNGLDAWRNANWDTAWARQWGISSTQDFINNQAAQRDAIARVAASNYRALGDTSNLVGQTRYGLTLNDAMLVECAYVLGGRGCRGALNGEEPFLSQAMSNRVFQRMAGAANLDVSAVTGRAGQAGGGQAIDPRTGQALPNERPAIEGMFCDPQILETIQSLGAQEVDRRVALAADPRTGFSTLNGQGVLAMAGLGSGGSGSGGMGNQSFFSMSCLDRILNTGAGINDIFQLPSWNQLRDTAMRMAQNFVCSQANQMYSRLMQPVNQALYRNANLDNFIPGAGAIAGQMGVPTSVSAGQFVSVGQGSSGGFTPLDQRFRFASQSGGWGSGGGSVNMGSSLLGSR